MSIYTVDELAKGHFLDLDIALSVAETSDNAFCNDQLFGDCYVVGSFHVDKFIAEVRMAQGSEEENDLIRKREIDRRVTKTEIAA